MPNAPKALIFDAKHNHKWTPLAEYISQVLWPQGEIADEEILETIQGMVEDEWGASTQDPANDKKALIMSSAKNLLREARDRSDETEEIFMEKLAETFISADLAKEPKLPKE